jgi:copper(I)-binding protein
MRLPTRLAPALTLAMLFAAGTAPAQTTELGTIRISQPHARATVPQQPSGAAYLSLENAGKTPDRLLALSSPAARSVEIHTMSMDGDVMRMREIGQLELPPSSTVTMQPGHGYHLMLTGLARPLKAGDSFPLTLVFEKAGKVEVKVSVDGQPGTGGHRH